MSITEASNWDRKAFHRRIAEAASRLEQKKVVARLVEEAPQVPAPFVHFSRYVLDDAYHRAWSIELLDYDPRADRPCPRIEHIQRIVCEHYKITRTDLLSQRRTAHIVWPRQIAVHLCRRLTMRSYPEIGRRFGGRDHTTVLHAFNKIGRLAGEDAELRATLDELIERLGGEK